jgi:hypothetical protein
MTPLEDDVGRLAAEGWEVVGHGKVLIPFEAKHPKPTFTERVEGFVGVLPGEKLLDDDEQWFQLRRLAGAAGETGVN